MYLVLGRITKAITRLPTPTIVLVARLAQRIADRCTEMDLSTHHINACVRDGVDCYHRGYRLEAAYQHAVDLAGLLQPFTHAGEDHEQSN